MRIYLVGGAVRDKRLGREVADRDYVVVGARPEDLLAQGFRPVGSDFPVFLHPQTGEEYALARTERKSGRGYHGFTFHTDPSVTLEEDLARRDLTINAMAEDEHGGLVDPHGGAADLKARLLRHVSPAFVEDPVRVLRVARFAARYAPLGFRVAEETMTLMRRMTDEGEIDHLVPERVWTETRKALTEPQPSAFLRVLREAGALRVLFPELDALYGVPQRADFHPEVDTGVHIELVVDAAARLAPGDDLVGFCALVHDLGKALTPETEWPRHVMHEQRGVSPLRALAERLKLPVEHRELGTLVCREHLLAHRALQLKPKTILKLLETLDALRRPHRLEVFVQACQADARGRTGHAKDAYPQGHYLHAARDAAARVTAAPFLEQGLEGPAIGAAMQHARIDAIAALDKPSPA